MSTKHGKGKSEGAIYKKNSFKLRKKKTLPVVNVQFMLDTHAMVGQRIPTFPILVMLIFNKLSHVTKFTRYGFKVGRDKDH